MRCSRSEEAAGRTRPLRCRRLADFRKGTSNVDASKSFAAPSSDSYVASGYPTITIGFVPGTWRLRTLGVWCLPLSRSVNFLLFFIVLEQ